MKREQCQWPALVAGIVFVCAAFAAWGSDPPQAVDNTGTGATGCIGPNCTPNNPRWPPRSGIGGNGGSGGFVMDQRGNILSSALGAQVSIEPKPAVEGGENGYFSDAVKPKWGEVFTVMFAGGPYGSCTAQVANGTWEVQTVAGVPTANGQNASTAGGYVNILVWTGLDGHWPYVLFPSTNIVVNCFAGNWPAVTNPNRNPICHPTPMHHCQ